MNQQEKTKRTKERILAAALAEFGTNSYESASINAICSKSQISKGLIYHNFQSKDDLYLQCVRICYDQMLEYLKTHMIELQEVPDRLRNLFLLRQTFFSEHPYYANIFFHSILWPPAHLLDEIQAIRTDFDQFYRMLLDKLPSSPAGRHHRRYGIGVFFDLRRILQWIFSEQSCRKSRLSHIGRGS
ncbi:MAG: TetR/AcrR family transcriptional regulator [Hungatella sp.]